MARAACGVTDPGRQRDVNEDRVYVDAAHGLYMVVDGIGGQAAGGRAADLAVQSIRQQIEGSAEPPAERVRHAIAAANNEIYRAAAARPEWTGMACVLTVVLADGERAVVGHVGDTRLYRITVDGLEKVTRDHSPIGEREDAGEISETEAMRHPRRNEVYRDVGSELHGPGDPEFIDVQELPLAPDEAFLLCSDGLTDVVDSGALHRLVLQQAGDPDGIAHRLIDAANEAGGKDNIAAIYSEGPGFAVAAAARAAATTRRRGDNGSVPAGAGERLRAVPAWRRSLSFAATLAGGAILGALLMARLAPEMLERWREPSIATPAKTEATLVQAGDSINAALQSAAPGSEIFVAPGEYREQVALVSGVRLVSQIPRAATLRLPGSTGDNDAAVVASGVTGAELRGFRIVGDASAPLATGVLIERSSLSIVDVDIAGATRAAVDVLGEGTLNLVGSRLYDNPGTALNLHAHSTTRVANTTFEKNGASGQAAAPIVVAPDAAVDFAGNTLHGVSPAIFAALGEVAAAIERDNTFLDLPGRHRPGPDPAALRHSRSRR